MFTRSSLFSSLCSFSWQAVQLSFSEPLAHNFASSFNELELRTKRRALLRQSFLEAILSPHSVQQRVRAAAHYALEQLTPPNPLSSSRLAAARAMMATRELFGCSDKTLRRLWDLFWELLGVEFAAHNRTRSRTRSALRRALHLSALAGAGSSRSLLVNISELAALDRHQTLLLSLLCNRVPYTLTAAARSAFLSAAKSEPVSVSLFNWLLGTIRVRYSKSTSSSNVQYSTVHRKYERHADLRHAHRELNSLEAAFVKRSRATQETLAPEHHASPKRASQRAGGRRPQVQMQMPDSESALSTNSGGVAVAAGRSLTAASLVNLLAATIRQMPLADSAQLDQWLALYRLLAARHTGKPYEKVACACVVVAFLYSTGFCTVERRITVQLLYCIASHPHQKLRA